MKRAIVTITDEGAEIMEEYKGSPAAAQAVEHYEISRYGTLRAWAEELGLDEAVKLSSSSISPSNVLSSSPYAIISQIFWYKGRAECRVTPTSPPCGPEHLPGTFPAASTAYNAFPQNFVSLIVARRSQSAPALRPISVAKAVSPREASWRRGFYADAADRRSSGARTND